jgi:hypothetical protein
MKGLGVKSQSSLAVGAVTLLVDDMKLSRVSMYFHTLGSSFLLTLWFGKKNHDFHNYTWR